MVDRLTRASTLDGGSRDEPFQRSLFPDGNFDTVVSVSNFTTMNECDDFFCRDGLERFRRWVFSSTVCEARDRAGLRRGIGLRFVKAEGVSPKPHRALWRRIALLPRRSPGPRESRYGSGNLLEFDPTL
jgi:hypothetical protein